MGEVAVLVLDGTMLVRDAVARHKTAPTSSAALGRTLMGTLLLASFRKDEEATQVSFRGNGPIDGLLAIADTRGNVKCKIGNPNADPPLKENGKLDVGAAVGLGVLAVVRSHPLQPLPYTGMVPIVSGEIAEDLVHYLVDSEQTNSALGLGVSLSRDCSVQSAGGFLVQVLPFCSEETLTILEANLGSMPTITKLLNDGLNTTEITEMILSNIGVSPGAQAMVPRYGPCNDAELKERMMRAVASLGKDEVQDIMRTEGKIEVSCDFCAESYQFEESAILQVITDRAAAKALAAAE
ncbi:MAG: hypothetical protein WDW36_003050 [Sanguina aurantia]